MEPPQNPVDIKITLGDAEGQHNLLNVDLNVLVGQNHVAEMKERLKLSENFEDDLVLVLDFHVETGREKDAVQYFNEGAKDSSQEGLSPLQKMLAGRPSEDSSHGKFIIQEFPGFVRLMYRFYKNGDFEDMQSSLQNVINLGFSPSAHVNVDLKGFISHNKKNRTNVKVNYSRLELVSNTFSSEQMLNTFSGMGMFEGEPEVVVNPMFDLMKKSKTTKANIKLASFRKISKFYSQVANQEHSQELKGFPYVNRAIFRQKCDINFAFGGKITANLAINYESEDIFIRLLKVYATMLKKACDIDLTENWW